jgi:hypothetical protein
MIGMIRKLLVDKYDFSGANNAPHDRGYNLGPMLLVLLQTAILTNVLWSLTLKMNVFLNCVIIGL